MATVVAENVGGTAVDEDYARFEALIQARVAACRAPAFDAHCGEGLLWRAYLESIPEARRQHYNCRACQRFIERFGGLVTICDDGSTKSALWSTDGVPAFFRPAVAALAELVERARVAGVFFSPVHVLGAPQTGEWSHLSGVCSAELVVSSRIQSASQRQAERQHEYELLQSGLAAYSAALVQEAIRVLGHGAMARSEKALGPATWFAGVHAAIVGLRGARRDNFVRRAAATAPAGYCHVRSTVIATLLDDLAAGLPFDAVARRWAEKMDPLQYRRPTAPPADGAIDQANKLIAGLGAESAFQRRYATLDDVLAKLWVPPPAAERPLAAKGGMFDVLRSDGKERPKIKLPEQTITWVKFRDTVLPTAQEIKIFTAGGSLNFYGLTTAAVPDAVPILQWDGLDGLPRNPAATYVYQGGSIGANWGLRDSPWAPVTAVFATPAHWQRPERFRHCAEGIHFAVEGCVDLRTAGNTLSLFPETLKAELHAVRAAVEAYSRAHRLAATPVGSANGLWLGTGEHSVPLHLDVRDGSGWSRWKLDRWD